MPRPRTDLHRKVRETLGHTLPLPSEASSPIRHFDRNANAIMSTLRYIEGHLARAGFYASVCERHLANLRRMALASLVESFERFLKELAVHCIDSLVAFVNHADNPALFDSLDKANSISKRTGFSGHDR
jgi:hypothetical protein